MVARGRVQNGIIVLEDGVRLPEGQEVTVVGQAPAPAMAPKEARPHRVMDIPAVSLGSVLSALTEEDDLLGEMLEGRS